MSKALNLKNMIETYASARGDMKEVWDSFYMMKCCGFISWETWSKFFDKCKSWEYDWEINACVDASTDKIIKQF